MLSTFWESPGHQTEVLAHSLHLWIATLMSIPGAYNCRYFDTTMRLLQEIVPVHCELTKAFQYGLITYQEFLFQQLLQQDCM